MLAIMWWRKNSKYTNSQHKLTQGAPCPMFPLSQAYSYFSGSMGNKHWNKVVHKGFIVSVDSAALATRRFWLHVSSDLPLMSITRQFRFYFIFLAIFVWCLVENFMYDITFVLIGLPMNGPNHFNWHYSLALPDWQAPHPYTDRMPSNPAEKPHSYHLVTLLFLDTSYRSGPHMGIGT